MSSFEAIVSFLAADYVLHFFIYSLSAGALEWHA